jgi:nucleoside phosphorylase
MEECGLSFDVCIICALEEESRAVIDVFSKHCRVSFTEKFSQTVQYKYQYATIYNRANEPLTVLVICLPDSGPLHTALVLKPLLQEFHPRFAAMTGICAGYEKKVHLGDLVIAQYAYHYEEGKIICGPDGQLQHLPEMRTVSSPTQVIQYARGFDGWKKSVTRMKRQFLKRSLQKSEEPEKHIAPMASGMAVRGDNPFPWLTEHLNRKTLALDMEAASFYLTLCDFPHIRSLVVKGVCDYADMSKNDDYHEYAARASATYMLHFIQEYVTDETIPRREASPASDRAGPSPLPSRLLPADKSGYQSWISADTATFHIPGPSSAPLPIESAWTELRVLCKQDATAQLDTEQLLMHYHDHEQLVSRADRDGYNAKDVAEMGYRVVIIGGPGAGKSTLCRKMAHDLTGLEEVVLRVYLPSLASHKQMETNISAALIDIATNGFDASSEVREALLAQADCLIADGLDECGESVLRVANALYRWAIAHPFIRVVVTSRPTGYETGYFSGWEHYDLMPLTQEQVYSSSRKFIQALVPNATTIEKETSQFQEQLEKNSVASLAARNPLLLGFLIQLSLKKAFLADQRSGLYEQILTLWREFLPQGRKWQTSPPETGLAWYSLELIGWLLLSSEKGQTAYSHDWLIQQMSLPLAQAMAIPPLRASGIASDCLDFWRERGVLDRSYIGCQETYTFVHTTLNEYTAGRYLAHLRESEIRAWVWNKYHEARWREPLLLAVGCGAVEIVVETLLEINAEDEQATSALLFAAVALAEASIVPSTLAQLVIDRLIACLTATNPTRAYEVAEQGVCLVKKVPYLFAPLLRSLFQHPQQWTRFSALYWALESKENVVTARELEDFLDTLMIEDLQPHRRGAVFLRDGKLLLTCGWDFQNKMILRGAETLTRIRPDQRTRSLLEAIYQSSSKTNTGINWGMRCMLFKLGWREIIEECEKGQLESFHQNIEMWLTASYKADRNLLETILHLTSSSATSTKKRSKLKTLTVLLSALHISDMPMQDWCILEHLDDIEAIKAVLLGHIEALQLDKEELAQDTAWALATLQKENRDGMMSRPLSSLLPKFPIHPEIRKLDSLGVQAEDLIRALTHPSLFIMFGAAQLLEVAGEGKEGIASLLFKSDDERLLNIITQMVGTLWGIEARPLLIKRLNQGYTLGSWWLIEELPSLPGEHTDQQFQQTLLHALQAEEPRMAIAAVHVLQKLDSSLLRDMLPALQSAYLYWVERGEEAKTKSCHTVDHCPTCRTESNNACAHIGQLLHRL